ncbi:Cysteine-rich CPXCG [Alteromonadaceae bacterium 2753L.S.0a.02]|nr:Cysteine-rich CPXCG [Alteromonadaceae bacterium 2753L.S.0a.02]
MFAHTHTQKTTCPYCAERIEIVIDGSVEEQSFIEDCQVCCRPIQFTVYISGDDQVMIDAQGDNESY